MNKESKIQVEDIYESDFIIHYSNKKDGTKVSQIHKCYNTGKFGIISEDVFNKLVILYNQRITIKEVLK